MSVDSSTPITTNVIFDSAPKATKKSWRPTNKWIVARITAIAGLCAVLFTGDPAISDPEKLMIIAVVAEAGTAYFTRNESAPEGVTLKEADGS